MPVDRTWTVPEDENRMPEISFDGEGNLLLTPRVVSDDDSDGLHEAVLECLAILRRVGGTIQIASQRGEIVPSVVVTESFIFAYNSFTPLVRRLGEPDVEPPEEETDDDDLTPEEQAMHFPAGDPLADVAAQAQNEVPADAEPVAAVE